MAHSKQHLKDWWAPVLEMKFDDSEQESPFWVGTNNAVLRTPFDGIAIKAFGQTRRDDVGVFVSGVRTGDVFAIQQPLNRERSEILQALPKGTRIDTGNRWPIITRANFSSDVKKRIWIIATLNTYVNILRPRLKKWRVTQ